VRRPIFKLIWLIWPLWVWFSVMATGNHFWLDVLAGVVLASITMAFVYRRELRGFIAKLL
jgi:membrane-associated phospholipid phosphatase